MNKIPSAFQNTRPKPCLLMFPSLITLDGFYLLVSTQLTADLTPEWSGGSMFHLLSYIYAKTPFCCVETITNNTLNHQRVVVFYRLWANVAPTLNTAFSLTNVNAKWRIHCLLISSTPQLSHATSNYDRPKWVFMQFFGVFRDNEEFGRSERSASFASVRPRLKSTYQHLTVVSDGVETE